MGAAGASAAGSRGPASGTGPPGPGSYGTDTGDYIIRARVARRATPGKLANLAARGRVGARHLLRFTLAHLSDPHLSTLAGVRARDLCGKRLLGYLSWRRHRRNEHRSEILAAAVSDLEELRPEHVAITGDLTQIGLPHELRQADAWLRSLGAPSWISLVPGNHDVYARNTRREPFELWSRYMRSDEDALPAQMRSASFPYLRVRGNLALIGLSTALPTAPLLATGRVGTAQLRALAELLGESRRAGLFRVLLMHHPPCAEVVSRRKGLSDGARLREVLAGEGVELVLHGHLHRACRSEVATPGGRAPAFSVPSVSALGSRRPERRARYNLYSISRGESSWQVELTVRGYDPGSGRFLTEAQEPFSLPVAL